MTKDLDFPMPEGFTPPEGSVPGDNFDTVATFEWDEENDNLCLKAIGGIPIATDEKDDKPTEEEKPTAAPPEGSFKDAVMGGMMK